MHIPLVCDNMSHVLRLGRGKLVACEDERPDAGAVSFHESNHRPDQGKYIPSADPIVELKIMKNVKRLLSLVILSSLFLAQFVWAHAHLKTAIPGDQAVVASPAELTLTFSEGLNLKFSGVKLSGPDQKEVKLGEAMLMDEGKSFMVGIPARLAPGTYTVQWHALSVDGHKTEGSYSFSVAP
ncbi:copper homeostasis periplasmic binding protein CopC [Herbaspirillum huttiense]|uniref:copper homeostasis periplasmic binding protein CopC n=1 Tax=Herbaspirillum huttiense TaxID=863372 RepID=UPI001F0D25B1|nr:copper homeostasis periplasmic binding protein CopC [Herbaspirillum huttiense]